MVLLRCALLAFVSTVAACHTQVPSSVKSEIDATPSGVTTVVVYTDFQCPFCRRMHASLGPLLDERKGAVRVVWKHVPLRSHPDAAGAASAAVCVETIAPEQTLAYAGDLARSLDLSPGECEELAIARGIDRDRFRACLAAKETAARLARDRASFVDADGDGVPLVFIGRTRIDGAQRAAAYREALEK